MLRPLNVLKPFIYNEISVSQAHGISLAVSGTMSDQMIWKSLKNGLHRKCPHCGAGALLDGWMTVRDRCPACGLVYERSAGDTWAFWIIGDRIPIAIAVAAVYFGVGPRSWIEGALAIGAVATALIATIPHRVGLVVALDYLSRRWWPDPNDAMP
jgi:uncharacterized protein (DUF983 family)